MRFVLHVSIPPEKFNAAVRDGTVKRKLEQTLEEIKPEAAYFCAKDGNRGGFLIVNMENTSEIPKIAEPWFLNFNARVEFLPAMTPEDLAEADLDKVGRKWK